MKAVLAALATMLGLILIVINLRSLDNENNLFAISSFILILAIVFLGLLLLNKYYNKLIVKLPSELIVFALIITGFIAIDISLINRIKSLELWKWTSIYIFIIALVFYWISELKQEPFRQK